MYFSGGDGDQSRAKKKKKKDSEYFTFINKTTKNEH